MLSSAAHMGLQRQALPHTCVGTKQKKVMMTSASAKTLAPINDDAIISYIYVHDVGQWHFVETGTTVIFTWYGQWYFTE